LLAVVVVVERPDIAGHEVAVDVLADEPRQELAAVHLAADDRRRLVARQIEPGPSTRRAAPRAPRACARSPRRPATGSWRPASECRALRASSGPRRRSR